MRKLLILSSVLILSMSLFAMGMKNTNSTANNCIDKAKSCVQQTTTNNNCNCCCCGTNCSTATTTTGSAIKK